MYFCQTSYNLRAKRFLGYVSFKMARGPLYFPFKREVTTPSFKVVGVTGPGIDPGSTSIQVSSM